MPSISFSKGIADLVAAVQANIITSSGIGVRIAAAAVLMPVTVGLSWVGGLAFTLLLLACAALLCREWARLCGAPADSISGLTLAAGALAIIGGAFFLPHFDIAAVACVLLYFILRRLPSGGRSAASQVWLAAGALMIVPAGLSLVWLRTIPPDGFALVLWVFAVVWSMDIGAFLAGKTIGGPRLAPAISPKKTWAGLIGGLTGAALMGFAFSYAVSGEAMLLAAVAGLFTGLAAGAGDLFESFVKRRFQAKDSGGMIPGHGGFLDRLDSLLTAAPVAVILYSLEWRWL